MGYRDRDNGEALRRMLDATDMMALYERLTGRSSNGKRTARGILVTCPTGIHGDSTPSCSLNPDIKTFHTFCCTTRSGQNAGGGILDLIVFAGAAPNRGEAVKWLKESGLVGFAFDYRSSPAVAFPSPSSRKGSGGAGMHLAESYLYVDDDGKVPYRVDRMEWPSDKPGQKNRKTFWQMHAYAGDGESCALCVPSLHGDFDELRDDNEQRARLGARFGLTERESEAIGSSEVSVAAHTEMREFGGEPHCSEGASCDACTSALASAAAKLPRLKSWFGLRKKYGIDVPALRRLEADRTLLPPAHPGEFRFGILAVPTKIPYQLADVRAAVAEGKPLFDVEGEKCAKALKRIGFYAFTNAGGAACPFPDEWRDYFVGARTVIHVADCDVAGRSAVLRRHRKMESWGVPSLVMDLDPNSQLEKRRTDKFDIADWIEEREKAGATIEEMREGVRALYQRALEEYRLPSYLFINAPSVQPKDPTSNRYVFVTSAAAEAYLSQLPFDGVYVGADGGDAAGLAASIASNGATKVRFSSKALAVQAAYSKLAIAATDTPTLDRKRSYAL